MQLLYFDGVVEKKVPKGIYSLPRKSTTEGGSEGLRCDHPIFVPLVKGKYGCTYVRLGVYLCGLFFFFLMVFKLIPRTVL